MPYRCLLGINAFILVVLHLRHVEIENLLLDHLRVLALERITLVEHEVYTASKCPYIDFLTEARFL